MIYKVTNTVIKIKEKTGTIQNKSRDYDIEVSQSPDFTDKILLLPRQKFSFSDVNIYLQCAEEGFTAEVFVVPFMINNGGGGGSTVISSDTHSVATNSEIDAMLDEFLPV